MCPSPAAKLRSTDHIVCVSVDFHSSFPSFLLDPHHAPPGQSARKLQSRLGGKLCQSSKPKKADVGEAVRFFCSRFVRPLSCALFVVFVRRAQCLSFLLCFACHPSWSSLLPLFFSSLSFSFVFLFLFFLALQDTGIDPAAAGLRVTSEGKPKLIDCLDVTGSGDVDTTATRTPNHEHEIVGLSGKVLKLNRYSRLPFVSPRYTLFSNHHLHAIFLLRRRRRARSQRIDMRDWPKERTRLSFVSHFLSSFLSLVCFSVSLSYRSPLL